MLSLRKITKSFPGRFSAIIKSLDLEISPEEFCVIIGSNGSGKSTLMRCISKEYSIDSGSISSKRNLTIAAVTQDISKGTISEMTLLENFHLSKLIGKSASFKFYNNDRNEAYALFKELNIGLEKYIDQTLGALSGGQRQMIATLMAINSNPDILLLDEHTSALDPNSQKLLMEYTAKSIKDKKITSIMITHRLDDAIRYGNRLIMLHEGEIVFDIKGKEKQELNVEQLLKLFHKYEDLSYVQSFSH